MLRYARIGLATLPLIATLAMSETPENLSVPMWQQDSGGFYVRGVFSGEVSSDMLVDTGSSYVVLSRETFAKLKHHPATVFQRTIRGATAAGRVMEAKVYSIPELALSEHCVLRNVEAVVLPSANRDILGLSALRRLQPFEMQFEPAALTMTTCDAPKPLTAAAATKDRPADG